MRSGPGLIALLLLHLAAVAYLTLRPSRILFSCREGVLRSRDPDWNLFLAHDTVRWDGAGRLELRATARMADRAAGVGLVPILFGSKSRERALIAGWRPADEGVFVRWHDQPVGPTPDTCVAGSRDAQGFTELRATAWRDGDAVRVRVALAGQPAVERAVPTGDLEWPARIGLWTSRPGLREFGRFDALLDGRALVQVAFDRPASLDEFTAVIGETVAPFSLGHAPFFRSNRYGLWNTLREDGLDVFNNLLLFAPTGVLLALLLRRRPVLWATLACFVLSLTVELLQLQVPTRVSSLYDLLCNTLGGTWAAWLTVRWLRSGRRRSGARAASPA